VGLVILTAPLSYYNISTTLSSTLSFVIMSRDLMLTLLRKGNTGTEILSILDAIVSDDSSSSDDTQGGAVSYTTGEAIVF
jgi:hypothetical protein